MSGVVSIDEMTSLIGTEIGVSSWFTIDQERIDAFAEATNDHQFIHVDPELAEQTPFGSTIAHGFLTLSLLTYLCEDIRVLPEGIVMGLNYGTDKVRFLNPVKVDQNVRARLTLTGVTPKGDNRYLITNEVTVEIEGEDKPALVAEWLTMAVTG